MKIRRGLWWVMSVAALGLVAVSLRFRHDTADSLVPPMAAAAVLPPVPAQPAPPTSIDEPPAPAVRPPLREAPVTPATIVENAQRVEALPAGVFREQLRQLPARAQARALARLTRFQVPKEDYASLRVTTGGDLYYACDFLPPAGVPAAGISTSDIPPVSGPRPIAAAAPSGPQAAPVPISSPPLRHSRPGASKVIYLDFSGHTIANTLWNTNSGVVTYVAKPYDTDASPTTFSDSEQADIIEVWSRVAEDYAPFDVDVTTEEPAAFGPYIGRVVITPNVDGNGVNMPSHTAGGVAFVGVFGESDFATVYSPAFVYSNQVGGAANIAEALSHEVGHNMGLSHDGKVDDPGTGPVDPAAYYGGHGTGDISWGPLMGTGYGRNVSQWSKGEYYLANNPQDDFADIASVIGYRADEAGGTTATTAVAPVTSGSLTAAGVIASVTDLDVYAFNTGAGTVSLSVAPFVAAAGTRGGNADLKLELLDAGGSVVASADPAATTQASLSYGAAAGKYFIRLTPVGTGDPLAATPTGYTSYGSAGQYTLTGTFVAAAPVIVSALSVSTPVGALFNYAILGTNAPTSYSASGLPAGLGLNTATGVISGRPTSTGVFSVLLAATNGLGPGVVVTLTLTVTDAAPAITAQTSGRQSVVVANPLSLSVTALSGNGTPTYQWRRNGRVVPGATSATLNLAHATMADAGVYRVYVTNTIGTTAGDPIFVQIAPLASAITGWGSNQLGQTTIPVGLTDAIAIAGGPSHALALKVDGTVVAWGSNSVGQTSVPAGLTDVVAIAAGGQIGGSSPTYDYTYEYSLALKADGTLVGWGSGGFGVFDWPGDLSGVVAIAAGTYHAMALKSDGTVVTWGTNFSGQLDVPVGLSDVIAIGAGREHSIAVKADGTVVAWGTNGYGETNVPGALATAIEASGGGYHSVALKADGTVANWGFGGYGAAPGGFNTGRHLSAGYSHVVALKSNGTVAAWGSNVNGQTTVPGGITNAFDVTAGAYFSLALQETTLPVTPSFSTHPLTQTVGLGDSVTLTVVATGTPAPTLQWYKDGNPIGSATGTSYMIDPIASGDAGSYTVVATNASGSATSNAAVLTLNQLAQTINFPALSDTPFTTTPISFGATASSGLPVYFLVTGPALAAGNSLTLTGTGTVTIVASQPGDATYAAALDVQRTFNVTANFASWRQGKFTGGELSDANISGPHAIFGADGLSNLVKYALGLEPKQNITTGLPVTGVVGSDWTYTYTRPSDRTELTYTVEVSANLSTWTSAGVMHEQVSSSGGTETWRGKYPLASAANVFFRLKVVQP